MRSVERLSGLSLGGRASIGPIHFETPSLLWTRIPGSPPSVDPPPGLELLAGSEAPSGHRRLALVRGSDQIEVSLPILSPEVAAAQGEFHDLGGGIFLVHWPLTDAQLTSLRAASPQLLILGNARVLFGEGEGIVSAITSLRHQVGGGPLLWAPRVGLPNRLALLAYLGVDLIDDTEARWRASQGEYLDATFGALAPEIAWREGRCPCEGCRGSPPRSLELHALSSLRGEWAQVRTAIAASRLRELVETRSTSDPLLGVILRQVDRLGAPLLEERTPVTFTGMLGYVATASHRRPEVVRFRRRLIERYRPPPSKRVLLVLPCSRTKPYRRSRSHRRFAEALDAVPRPERIHVASVTSPLGLVPRELEDVYPARHYDVPVTGDWSELERLACIDALRHLLGAGSYSDTVLHLDRAEYGFLDQAFDGRSAPVWSCPNDHPTSAEALESMRRTLGPLTSELSPIRGGPLSVVREELEALASFQFGPEGARRLFAAPVRLAGRPWFQRLTDGKATDLATWREERGLFQLTVAGGQRLLGLTGYEVEVDPAVELTGDLFGPGVAAAGPDIRVGDAVLLVRAGELLGVGEAETAGSLMSERLHGRAVTVRHRRRTVEREAAGTNMVEERPGGTGPVV